MCGIIEFICNVSGSLQLLGITHSLIQLY